MMKQVSNLNIVTYSAKGESLFSALKTLWFYKNLIWVFAKRDLQVKYAQTYLGFTWSVFKPLLGLSIYTFFFGFILNWAGTYSLILLEMAALRYLNQMILLKKYTFQKAFYLFRKVLLV